MMTSSVSLKLALKSSLGLKIGAFQSLFMALSGSGGKELELEIPSLYPEAYEPFI